MIAGLPGVGIGGIYYVVMAFVMPLRKAKQAINGLTTPFSARWVAGHLAIAMGMVAVLWGEYYILYSGFEFVQHHVAPGTSLAKACSVGNQSVVPAVAALPFILLLTIMAVLAVLRKVVHKPPTRLARDRIRMPSPMMPLQPALQQPS